ncbi:MAG: YjgP/YjgQ family permease [bacterium]|nr:YjgP/YjgQ family permease [bacterium]
MKLQAYIFRQLLAAFSFAVGAILFIALPGIAASTVHKLPNADAVVLIRYLPLVLQNLVPQVLPICFLLSVVATYGRLAADREWTAIQMAGIQPLKTYLPALAVALLVSGGTYWMLSNQLPTLRRKARDLLVEATSSSIANLAPGRTRLQIGEFYLKGAWRDRDTGVFREVYIHRPEDEGKRAPDIFAESADIRVADNVLFVNMKGTRVVGAEDGAVGEFEDLTIQYPLDDLVQRKGKRSSRAKYIKSSVIREKLASGTVSERLVPSYRYELQARAAFSCAYLLFLGLGVPTGLLLRRGTQLAALAVAMGYGIIYYILSMQVGKDIGLSGDVPPWVGAWSTTLFGLVVSLVLIRKAMRR